MKAFGKVVERGSLTLLSAVIAALSVVSTASASDTQLLSIRHTSASLTTAANGDSILPRVSANGAFIVFSSTANDLTTNDNSHQTLDVFLHERSSSETWLASKNRAGTGGGNGHSLGLQVSTLGRYVLLQSDASDLLPGDTNEATDIFIRDTLLGTNILVSAAAGGEWGNGDSTDATMTPDGRWVAFVSEATNIVFGDTNDLPDLFLCDRVLGTTALVTAGATSAVGVVSSPRITPSGRFLAFFSSAKGMVGAVPPTSDGEIYLYDSVLGQMTWVSTNAAVIVESLLNLVDMPSTAPALSDDGRFVAFKTGWTNGMVNPPGSTATVIFVYDSVLETTTVVTTNAFPPWVGSDDVYGPEMTPDGRFVAYVEREAAGTNTESSIRLWNRLTGTNVVVSVNTNGVVQTLSESHTPSVSENGQYVTFLSDALDLVNTTVSNGFHIYRRDLLAASTEVLDVNAGGGASGDQFGVVPSMSGDGACVTFSALVGDLAPTNDNKGPNVFLWDETTGTNVLVSARHASAIPESGNRPSSLGAMSLSGDGSLAAFASYASYASDLVTNDFNDDCDVFIHDPLTGSNLLVSVGLDGNAGSGGGSHSPVLSGDGAKVLFVSEAVNLVPGDNNDAPDLFLRDFVGATTIKINVKSNGVPLGDLASPRPVMSPDARYVAFVAGFSLYWRDLISGVTHTITDSENHFLPLSMSADGQRVAYFDNASNANDPSRVHVWDAISLTTVYSSSSTDVATAALSPTGDRLLFQRSTGLYVRDLPGVIDTFLYPSDVPIKSPAQWSGDGQCVVFVTGSNLVTSDMNGTNDVYLRNLDGGTLALLSVNAAGTASANGASDWPVFSADGRFVAFRSFAMDIASGIVRPPSLMLFDRVTGSNTLLVTGTSELDASAALAQPALSTNGTTVAFHGWDAGLVPGDLNRAGDAFAVLVDYLSPLDSDGDGIPDWWTIEYFDHPTGQADDLSRAQDDADVDSLTNLEEFHAGTIPTEASSVLACEIVEDGLGGDFTLRWPAVAGRNYQVYEAVDLGNPGWQLVPEAPTIVGGWGSLQVQASGSTHYFRVLCQ